MKRRKCRVHVHATGSDVAHIYAKVVEHESEEGGIACGALCGRW